MESAATWYSAGPDALGGLRHPGDALVLAGISALGGAPGGWRRRRSRRCWRAASGRSATRRGPSARRTCWPTGGGAAEGAAIVPIAATVVAVAVSYLAGGRKLEGAKLISVHDRTLGQAIDPIQGAGHMFQAIPETLVLGNLGLSAETTLAAGARPVGGDRAGSGRSLLRAGRPPQPAGGRRGDARDGRVLGRVELPGIPAVLQPARADRPLVRRDPAPRGGPLRGRLVGGPGASTPRRSIAPASIRGASPCSRWRPP